MCKEECSIVVNLVREGENKKTIRKIMEDCQILEMRNIGKGIGKSLPK